MKFLFIFLFLFGCSTIRFNDKGPNSSATPEECHEVSFQKADTNNDLVIDLNESIAYFDGIKTEEVYSPAYSFLFIISLVFLFVFFCILFSRDKD